MNAPGQLPPDRKDCLLEVVNVSMGRVGDALARYLSTFICLSVPEVKLLEPLAARNCLPGITKSELISTSKHSWCGPLDGGQIVGDLFVICSDDSVSAMASLMCAEEPETRQAKENTLLELSSVMNDIYINALGSQLGIDLKMQTPAILTHGPTEEFIDKFVNLDAQKVLVVDVEYSTQDGSVCWHLLMIMYDQVVDLLSARLGVIVDEL